MHRYKQLHNIYTVARFIQKKINILFLKSSTFVATIVSTFAVSDSYPTGIELEP